MNQARGRNRKGHIYRRWKKKKYSATDTSVSGKGVLYLRYMVGGKIIEESLRTGDLEEAKRKADSIMKPLEVASRKDALLQTKFRLEKLDEELVQYRNKLLLSDSWNAYLENLDRPDTGVDTLRYYHGYLKRFLTWLDRVHPESKFISDITVELAREYATTLSNSGVSPETFNKHIGFLKLFFRVLEDACNGEANPFARIRKKRRNQNVRRALTISELKTILEKAEGDLQILLYIGTFTGLRLGDCCTLKWNEIDLKKGVIRRIPNKTGKNKKAIFIGLPIWLHEKLMLLSSEKRGEYVVPKYAEMYNYRNESGSPVRQPKISKEIQAHFEKCGIQTLKEGTGVVVDPETGKKVSTGKRAVVEVGFHSLRHTFVSLHAERGTPEAVVQAVVGHGSPAMTAHYTHIGEETARQVAGVLTLGDSKAEEALDDIQQKLDKIRELASRITGKRNEGIKAELLEMLNDGEG